MSFENLVTNLANRTDRKPPKTQEELREIFKSRFNQNFAIIDKFIDLYDKMVSLGMFDDKDGEEIGTGEEKRQKMISAISSRIDKLEALKNRLDSGEDLPQSTPVISVKFEYKNGGVSEVISIDFEKELAGFITFYQNHNIDIPADFTEQMQDIWERNHSDIEQAMEKEGYDGILIIPANIPLPELSEKMKIENGYCDWIDSSGNTVESLPATTIISQRVDKPRIILYHKATLPELEARGIPTHLEITAGEAEKLYKQNPDNYLGTLEDAIILERKHFEETGEHLSDYTKGKGQWLSGTKSGSRFVYATWGPSDGELYVNANDPGNSRSDLGCRPSRYFF
jgi:hypothetical protein